MAVDAQYHHLLISHPQLYKNRESMNTIENAACIHGGPVGFPATGSLSAIVPTTAEGGGFGVINSSLSRKRSRDSFSFLGEDISPQIYDHMLDVDRLIVQHVMNARIELSQKRKQFSSQIIAALHDSVSKQLKSKEEEIEQLRKLNWAMEERIKSLGVENNTWRYLAQTHEAAATALRANLEQVLANQTEAAAAADDAESCCGDNFVPAESAREWKRMCRNCGDGEPSVLLLPCRHLCLCSACGPVADACPICKCCRTGSVNVNLC